MGKDGQRDVLKSHETGVRAARPHRPTAAELAAIGIPVRQVSAAEKEKM